MYRKSGCIHFLIYHVKVFWKKNKQKKQQNKKQQEQKQLHIILHQLPFFFFDTLKTHHGTAWLKAMSDGYEYTDNRSLSVGSRKLKKNKQKKQNGSGGSTPKMTHFNTMTLKTFKNTLQSWCVL